MFTSFSTILLHLNVHYHIILVLFLANNSTIKYKSYFSMLGFENLAESVASGLAVLYNGTLLSDILLSLQHEDRSLATLLLPTIPYAVLLSIIATLLFTYYYMWLPIYWVQVCSLRIYVVL